MKPIGKITSKQGVITYINEDGQRITTNHNKARKYIKEEE